MAGAYFCGCAARYPGIRQQQRLRLPTQAPAANTPAAASRGNHAAVCPPVCGICASGGGAVVVEFKYTVCTDERFPGANALRLPCPYAFALALRHKRQNLQNQIGNERAHQVLAVSGVQKRHIHNADVGADLLGQNAPLPLNFLIIAAEPVDAEHIQQIACAKPAQKPLVLGPFKILAGLLVQKNVALRDAKGRQRQKLAVFILVCGRDADISVNI